VEGSSSAQQQQQRQRVDVIQLPTEPAAAAAAAAAAAQAAHEQQKKKPSKKVEYEPPDQVIFDEKELTRVQFVAEGGQGSVWEFQDSRSGGSYALKLPLGEDSAAALEEEHQIVVDMAPHPRLVKPLGQVEVLPGVHAAVFEYFPFSGTSWAKWVLYPPLQQQLQQAGYGMTIPEEVLKKLPAAHQQLIRLHGREYMYLATPEWRAAAGEVLRDQLRGLLQYMAWLHRAAVVHHDVKPENLLASTSGELCLADFGMAAKGTVVPEGQEPHAQFVRGGTLW
jgi:serine/threonine protein kinase